MNRLQQATGRKDLITGGIHTILCGDFGQLPPVLDTPLYINCKKTLKH